MNLDHLVLDYALNDPTASRAVLALGACLLAFALISFAFLMYELRHAQDEPLE
jgi:hypothetical protein